MISSRALMRGPRAAILPVIDAADEFSSQPRCKIRRSASSVLFQKAGKVYRLRSNDGRPVLVADEGDQPPQPAGIFLVAEEDIHQGAFFFLPPRPVGDGYGNEIDGDVESRLGIQKLDEGIR